MSLNQNHQYIQIFHRTHYRYSEIVQLNPHQLYLYPKTDSLSQLIDFDITISPDATLSWGRDVFENVFAKATFSKAATELTITTKAKVRVAESNPFDFLLDSHAVKYPFPFSKLDKAALTAYSKNQTDSDSSNVLEWIYEIFPSMPENTMDILLGMNQSIFSGFEYNRREEEGIQSPNQTLQLKKGSCRDFSWLFLNACQLMGLPARFVSGYVSNVTSSSGQRNIADRASGSMHAWTEVYLPGAGWKGFDPTNGILTTSSFIPCAVSSQPDLISPIQGSFAGANASQSMEVDLRFSNVNLVGTDEISRSTNQLEHN